jgi:hypothetical protein
MTQSATAFFEQLAFVGNIPAIDGGAAILARLDILTNQMTTLTNQMTGFTVEIRARSVFSSLRSSIY